MDNLSLTHGLYGDIIGPETSMTGCALGLNNPYMNSYMNGYCYNTNFLGGVTMASPLARDTYSSVKMEKIRNVNGLKSAAIGTGLFIAGSIVLGKFSKLFKSIVKVFKK